MWRARAPGAGHRRRRSLRRISRRNPMTIRPAAKTSHGTRISRLAAVTVASLARRILGSLASSQDIAWWRTAGEVAVLIAWRSAGRESWSRGNQADRRVSGDDGDGAAGRGRAQAARAGPFLPGAGGP